MDFKIGKLDIIIVLIGLILAILSYIFYEANIIVSIAIWVLVILIYRRYYRNKKKKDMLGDEE